MSKKSVLTRRQIREKAIQSLFQLSVDETLTQEEAIHVALNINPDEIEDFEHQSSDVPYLVEAVEGVIKHKIEIDQKIQEQLENWNFSRIMKVDLAILRLAVYEMFYVSEEVVPKKVAINEAIELAKTFSEDKSPKFINGILSGMISE